MADKSTDILAKKIQEGMATKEERGIALKNVNTQMAVELVESIDSIKTQNGKLTKLRDLATTKLLKKGEQAINNDELELPDLLNMVSVLTDVELKVADMYRKILQGNRLLFDEDSLSEEQKVVVRLLNSFETIEQKKDFLNMASKFMQSKGTELQEAEVIEPE